MPNPPVRAALVGALLLFLNSVTLADTTMPDWLRARYEHLRSIQTNQPAHVDTLIALSMELLGHGQPGPAAGVLQKAGIQAFYGDDLDRALVIWSDGLELARQHEQPVWEVRLLNALAIGYSENEQLDEALAINGQVLALRSAQGDSLGISRTWGNLSLLYRQMGRHAEAMDALAEAERWNTLAGNAEGEVAVMVSRAAIYHGLGRDTECVQVANAALERVQTVPVRNARGQALLFRAMAQMRLGRADEALADVDRAITALEADGGYYYVNFALQWRVALLLELGRLPEARAALADFRQALDESDSPRLQTIQHLYAGTLALEEQQYQVALAELEQARITFEARRNDRRDLASRDGLFGNAGHLFGVMGQTHLALGDTLQAWQITERGQALGFRERLGDGDRTPDLATVQTALAEADAVLIQACETAVRPLTWFVITPTSLSAVNADDLAPMLSRARLVLGQLASGESLEACHANLELLSQALLGPLLPWLEQSPTHLYLVLPSTLNGLPLGVLLLPDGRRLGETTALNYVPSATSLPLLMARETVDQGLLALGAPDLGDPALVDPPSGDAPNQAGGLPLDPLMRLAGTSLPEAGREVRRIAGRHGQVYLGAEARLSTLLAEAPRAAVIHVASHALSDPVDGRRSALLLASDEVADGPAVLTAAGAETLALRADLTVLSACRSGLGNAWLGEGGMGLPRSLMMAGSRSVVSSLWDVDDDASRRFMEAFYRELRRGVPRDQALQLAADRLRRRGLPPRDWAAFVLSGVGHEPVRSLVEAGGPGFLPPLIWFGGSAVMVALIVVFTRRKR